MPPATQGSGDVTFVELEFDTGANGGARLGDIASSLVTLDELLRDLASIAAYPSSAEFRKVEIAAIELRSPLRIRLSLFAIAPAAISAFQEICRDVILFRGRDSTGGSDAQSPREHLGDQKLARLRATLERCVPEGETLSHFSESELTRIRGHMAALQGAEIRLKRVEVKAES